MEIEPDQDNPQKDRRSLNISEKELRRNFPETARLVGATVQRNRINNSIERVKSAAFKEFIHLCGGKGTIKTILTGQKVDVTMGSNSYLQASLGFESAVEEIHLAPFKILCDAAKDGEAEVLRVPDIHVVVLRDQADKSKVIPKPEEVASDATGRVIELSPSDMKVVAPNLRTLLFCQLQRKYLDRGLKRLNKLAKSELKDHEDTNIYTEFNHQEVRVSTFEREETRILPEFKGTMEKFKKAQKDIPNSLQALYGQGKAVQMVTQFLVLKPNLCPENKKT